MLRTIVLLIAVIVAATFSAAAADWPASMEIGGFTVSGISGTSNPDGSGRATGKITIPGDGGCQVDLTRGPGGGVSGSTRSSFSICGVKIEGSLMLDERGMQGTGVIYTTGKPITDANITVTPQPGLSAKGKVEFSSAFSVNVTCDGGSQGISVHGSSPKQATLDTALAVYSFRGDIDVTASGQALAVTANRVFVERKGKVGGVTSSFGPLSCPVDISSGEANLNLGGTNVVIDLW